MSRPWTRLGHVFVPESPLTHAMLPTPLRLKDAIRVYFASCDRNLRGRIFSVDLELHDPQKIVPESFRLVLDLGESNSFDADGVNPSCLVMRDSEIFLYYIGWKRSDNVPYTLLSGLAVSKDSGVTFEKISDHPILPPTEEGRFFRTAPYVYAGDDGRWNMLYISGSRFFKSPHGKDLPLYSLFHASSDDGINWRSESRILDPDPAQDQIGFGRPVLWHEDASPSLLLSERSASGYRLRCYSFCEGKLLCSDVLDGLRADWERDMTCFGAPLIIGGLEYLFYNGNGFGASGFGIAKREKFFEAPSISRLELLRGIAENGKWRGD